MFRILRRFQRQVAASALISILIAGPAKVFAQQSTAAGPCLVKDGEGTKPAPGYTWMYPNDPNNLSVRRISSSEVPDSLAALQRSAYEGSADAQYQLGLRYRGGIDLAKDDNLAYMWLWNAANQGHASAQYALGNMYYRGWECGASNPWEAGRYYKKSADQGKAEALDALGVLTWTGNGREKDQELAITLVRQSVAKGNAKAASDLKVMLDASQKQNKDVDDILGTLFAVAVVGGVAGAIADGEKEKDQKACMAKCTESRERCVTLCTAK